MFLFDACAFDAAFEGFCQSHVAEIVLLTFGDVELTLELDDAFLEVVMVDQVAFTVLKAVFACAERDAFPVFPLAFFRAIIRGGESPHVVFLQQGFALIPRPSAGGMEETLVEKLGK